MSEPTTKTGRATAEQMDELHGLVADVLITELRAKKLEGEAPSATVLANALKLLAMTKTEAPTPTPHPPGYDPLAGSLPSNLPPVNQNDFARYRAASPATGPDGGYGFQPKT